MITVHHLETSRSQRVLWLLEELGVPYEIVRYQRHRKTRLAPPELKAIHPLGKHAWFAGEQLTIADFQMSFPVEAALARGADHRRLPMLRAYKARMEARPAYRRALEKGGPVVMSA